MEWLIDTQDKLKPAKAIKCKVIYKDYHKVSCILGEEKEKMFIGNLTMKI